MRSLESEGAGYGKWDMMEMVTEQQVQWGVLKETKDLRADELRPGCVHSVTGKLRRPCGC